MRRAAPCLIALVIVPAPAVAQIACLPPKEPYPFAPPSDDLELRDLVNTQYQAYLTGVEDDLACLSEERQRVLDASQDILQRWIRYFGEDAAIQYELDDEARPGTATPAPPDQGTGG